MDYPSISYNLIFEERPQYLYARIQADTINRELAVAYLADVAAKCRSISCTRLILERDIPVMLHAGDLFFITQDFLNHMVNVRVAFVNPHAPIQNDMKFAVLIGTNRGGVYSLHDNSAAAEEWLLAD